MLEFHYSKDLNTLPALTLAYIGDAVYELYVRQRLLDQNIKVHSLHKLAVRRVNHHTQANLLDQVEQELAEDELAVARRGRNAKSGQVPKNADVITYRKSTGLEALVGYLYLKGESERLEWLLSKIEGIVAEWERSNHADHQF